MLKVVSISSIENSDNLESVILENGVECLVSKNLFQTGDTGYFIDNGRKILINDTYPWSSNFLKVKKGVYKIRPLKYKNKVYNGLFMSLKEKRVEYYENLILSEPFKKDDSEIHKLIPKVKELRWKNFTSKNEFYRKEKNSFLRTNLYIKKYMPGSTLIVCYSLEKNSLKSGSLTRNGVICESSPFNSYIIRHNILKKIEGSNLAVYGNIHNGSIYITNIYDLNAKCFFTIKDLIHYCCYHDLNHGYTAVYEGQFLDNRYTDYQNLFSYYEKNIEKNPMYMVLANNHGDLLRINKDTSLFSFFSNSLFSSFDSNLMKYIDNRVFTEIKPSEMIVSQSIDKKFERIIYILEFLSVSLCISLMFPKEVDVTLLNKNLEIITKGHLNVKNY